MVREQEDGRIYTHNGNWKHSIATLNRKLITYTPGQRKHEVYYLYTMVT